MEKIIAKTTTRVGYAMFYMPDFSLGYVIYSPYEGIVCATRKEMVEFDTIEECKNFFVENGGDLNNLQIDERADKDYTLEDYG